MSLLVELCGVLDALCELLLAFLVDGRKEVQARLVDDAVVEVVGEHVESEAEHCDGANVRNVGNNNGPGRVKISLCTSRCGWVVVVVAWHGWGGVE